MNFDQYLFVGSGLATGVFISFMWTGEKTKDSVKAGLIVGAVWPIFALYVAYLALNNIAETVDRWRGLE